MADKTPRDSMRLRKHYGFSRVPFTKHMWAAQMFDSQGQRELLQGLRMWTEVRGFTLVAGPAGVGKSITLRRFVQDLDEARFRVIDFSYLPTTVTGFLRSLSRKLDLPMRQHSADLFDQVQRYLVSYENDHGAHPVIVIDDAEGLPFQVIDLLRRLASYDLDSQDLFSIVLAGTDDILLVLGHPALESLRSRLFYVQALRPFGLEDTRNYIRFHLERADLDPKLFSDPAVKRLFQASKGRPRSINQLATQALIQAAVQGRDKLDGDFMAAVIGAHPLYQSTGGKR